MSSADNDVTEAAKKIGVVLENLEASTGSEVKDIALEDMVDTDPQTGKPVIKRAIDITLSDRPKKTWLR